MRKKLLYNKLLAYFRAAKLPVTSQKNWSIIVTGGVLKHYIFTPKHGYVAVRRISDGNKVVMVWYDLNVFYSIEILLYKMLKHDLLEKEIFKKLLKIYHNEQEKKQLPSGKNSRIK